MTKDELIAKQQIQIEALLERQKNSAEVRKRLLGMLYSIGAPLNDNNLQFDRKQLKWLGSVADVIEEF